MSLRIRILLSILSGLLVSLSFPIFLWGWHSPELLGLLGWFALVPLFLSFNDSSPERAFWLTFIASCIWFATSFFWVVHAMYVFGHIPLITSILLLVTLFVIMAAILSCAPYLAIRVSGGVRGETIIWISVYWVALEFLRNYFPFGGFPWSNIAMSQAYFTPLIQIADVAGVYGVLFLMVWFNYFISELILDRSGKRMPNMKAKTIITAVLIITAFIYGFFREAQVEKEMDRALKVQVAMIQGNISQEDKWDEAKAAQIMKRYRTAVSELLDSDLDLIVWPEAAFPWYVRSEITGIKPETLGLPGYSESIFPLTFLGAVTKAPENTYYNSGLLLDADGNILTRYHKAHLTPFGEYIPYRKLLFFARNLTNAETDFSSGDGHQPIAAGGFVFGPLICYEDIFPEISRQSVNLGAEFLVNITNNAWFGETSAPFQQLALSVFRAIENRRYLLRSTNTGISAVVAPTGKLLVESAINESATIVAGIGRLGIKTIYTRLGDWFAWGAVVYAFIGLSLVVYQKFKKRNEIDNSSK